MLFWEITDPLSLKQRFKTYFSVRVILLVGFWAILIIVQFLSRNILSWPKTGFDDLISFLGLVLFLLGFFIALWAKFTMRKNWGLPSQHDFQRQKELITSGPFRFSRHPIYLGLSFMFLGFSITLRSYLIFLNLIIIWRSFRASIVEEMLLTKYFGKDYLAYKKNVPRFIFACRTRSSLTRRINVQKRIHTSGDEE